MSSFKPPSTFIVKVTGTTAATAGIFPLAIPQDASVALAAFAPATINADGLLGGVVFTPQDGVTADTSFDIVLSSFVVADASGVQDELLANAVTTTLSFNQAPPAPTLGDGPADPVEGSSSDLTITNLAGGESIEFTITITGGAGASASVAGQTGTATDGSPLTVTISSASAGSETITLEGSGANSTVTIAATVDGVDAGTSTVVFSQLSAAELASFGGEIVEDSIVLDWTTVSQTNNPAGVFFAAKMV